MAESKLESAKETILGLRDDICALEAREEVAIAHGQEQERLLSEEAIMHQEEV